VVNQGSGWWLTLVVMATLTTACRTAPPPIPASQYTKFQSAFEPEAGSSLAATDTITDTHGIHIRFQIGTDTGYATASWPPVAPQAAESGAVATGIASLEIRAEASEGATTGSPVTILGAEDWQRLRDQALRTVVPDQPGAGVILRFPDDDYFLAYEAPGGFKARRLEDKPAHLQIAGVVTIETLLAQSWDILENYLIERDLPATRLLFNTGDTGAYSLPFVYADRTERLALFLRYVPQRTGALAHAGSATGQSLGHIARSHLTALIARPFTSVGRLFFVAVDAIQDTLRPDWLAMLSAEPIPPLTAAPPMDLTAWESELDGLTGRESRRGTLGYLIDGEAFFDRFIASAAAARKSILVRAYIFDNDDVAARVADLLKRRSLEGVEVKVLLDGLGTAYAAGEEPSFIPEYYEPPAAMRQYLMQDSEVEVRMVPNTWLTGDHVKTIIIDDKVVFTGGMNIGREYRYEWHDMMMEVRGPVVDRVIDDFHNNWAAAGPFGDLAQFVNMMRRHARNKATAGFPMRILYTRPGDSEIFRTQLAAIRNARGYIYIQNAYFTNDTLLFELARARRRGVDVRVILPLESDIGLLNRDTALVANAMLENGIRVFLYPGMSHIKAAVFDGWACLGSANLDNLSLRVNKELNIATSHPPAVDTLLSSLFEKDFERSTELLEPFPERWVDHLAEIFIDYFY
jgi:cardiolipin synthase